MNLNTSEKLILALISFNNHISRKQICEVSDLSPSSITKITKRLIADKYIIEGQHIGLGMGRKEVLLYSNPSKFHFLGIDIGGHHARFAIADNNLNVQYKSECLMKELEKSGDNAAAILEEINRLLGQSSGLTHSSINCVGISVTGIINTNSRSILTIPNRDKWDNLNIVDELEQALGCPVYLDEGGRSMALAEMKIGKAKDFNDFIVIHVGHGITAGIIINGQILKGVNNTAGLLGHITADPNGSICLCGNYGCLENIITYPMLEREYREQKGKYENILIAYQQKEKIAIDICLKAGMAFGIALSNVVNLFNPQSVLIGGLMFDDIPMLFEETKRTIILRGNRFSTMSLNTDKSSFGENEGIKGALVLAKSKFIDTL